MSARAGEREKEEVVGWDPQMEGSQTWGLRLRFGGLLILGGQIEGLMELVFFLLHPPNFE